MFRNLNWFILGIIFYIVISSIFYPELTANINKAVAHSYNELKTTDIFKSVGSFFQGLVGHKA